MPVSITSTSASSTLSKRSLWVLRAVATVVVVLSPTVSLAQRAGQSIPEPLPDKHKPPTPEEIDKMETNSGRNSPPRAATPTLDTCFLTPLNLWIAPSVAAGQLQIETKARNEYQKACGELQKKKTIQAEKHLRKAVSDDPKFAAAWVTLGQVLNNQRRRDDARQACHQASIVQPTYVAAYLCLAELDARQGAWDELLHDSTLAIELDPASDALAYEYNAAARLNLHQLSAAETSALRAQQIDRDNHDPRIHFVLAQIYEAKGDAINEAKQLHDYLKYAKDPSNVALVRETLSQLENASEQPPSLRLGSDLSDLVETFVSRSGPPDIDDIVPPVLTEANCPLPEILKETSNHTQDLIENLQQFSANERIEQIDIDKKGRRRSSGAEEMNYVVQIEQNSSGYPRVQEYRLGMGGVRRAGLMDSGTAAFALIFHPAHVGNFSFRCEGITEFQGSQVWQLRFEESTNPKKSFIAIRVGTSNYLPRFKGRAWVASGSYNVLRVETDLVSAIPEIDLQREHMVINYAPVEFQKRRVELWLPKNTALYMSFRGHHFELTHDFRDFQLFSVDSVEAIKGPAKDLRLQLRASQYTRD